MSRLFDILSSLIGILFLSPFLLLISLLIILDSGLPVFYFQERIGLHGKPFQLLKFRSMKTGSDKKGLLTIGAADSRITGTGLFLRKFKLDEIPQLFNVLKGDMALVGPRPEVRKYVDLYNEEQKQILNVRPGITDLASIEYINENDLLAASNDPEATYINKIMPHKIQINLRYIKEKSLYKDILVIVKTLGKIAR